MKTFCKTLLISGIILFGLHPAKAQYSVLLNFNGTNGASPIYSSLTLSGDNLYGMTENGGANIDGNIFSIQTNGSGYMDLLDFNGANGKQPRGSLTLSGKTLYGMTYEGGENGEGVIFKDSIVVTSINNITDNTEQINIFPNPTSGRFTIVGAQYFAPTIEIYNVLGEKVYFNYQIIKLSNYQIDLSSQPNGIYILRLTTKQGTINKRVVVER